MKDENSENENLEEKTTIRKFIEKIKRKTLTEVIDEEIRKRQRGGSDVEQ